jgi:ABC-type nickel/cobalt efflux system permease component RcnA
MEQTKPSLSRIALLGFLGIAAFLLWTEHRAHLLGVLPYLLLLACPLMHLLHGGHRHGHDHPHSDSRPDREEHSAKGDSNEP